MDRKAEVREFLASRRPVNVARFLFLSPRARRFFPEWDQVADQLAAALRTSVGQNPYDDDLSDLVDELRTRSEEFSVRWKAGDVRFHHTGTKKIHHPVVGDVQLDYESMPLPADPGLSLIVYSTTPGTADHDAMQRLAAWAQATDTVEHAQPTTSTSR
jgi:hypothetical protein